jgi:hypothetical protein
MTGHAAQQATQDIRQRFDRAQRDLAQIQEEIAPFVPKRSSDPIGPGGEWQSTSSLLREQASPVLSR